MSNLNDVFDDNQETEVAEVSAPEPETVENQDDQENIKAEPESATEKGDKEQETPSATDTEEQPKADEVQQEEPWTKKMALEERGKRQRLEQELETLKQQLSNKATPQEQPPAVDPMEDPQAFKKQLIAEIEQDLFEKRIISSKEEMIAEKPDYAELEQEFMDLSKNDPSLAQKLRRATNPAKFAYDTAMKARKVKDLSDPNFEVKLRAKIEKELLEKMANNQGQKAPKSESVVPSLSKKTSAASNTIQREEYKGTIDEVLGDDF